MRGINLRKYTELKDTHVKHLLPLTAY